VSSVLSKTRRSIFRSPRVSSVLSKTRRSIAGSTPGVGRVIEDAKVYPWEAPGRRRLSGAPSKARRSIAGGSPGVERALEDAKVYPWEHPGCRRASSVLSGTRRCILGSPPVVERALGAGPAKVTKGARSATIAYSHLYTLSRRGVVAAFDRSAEELDRFESGHWLSNPENVPVLRLTEAAWLAPAAPPPPAPPLPFAASAPADQARGPSSSGARTQPRLASGGAGARPRGESRSQVREPKRTGDNQKPSPH